MKQIPLQNIPNQALEVNVDNNLYRLTIKETRGVMCVTIERNGTTLLSNNRIVGGTPLIPYEYLEDGNFMFLTDDGDIPYYTDFQITQFLYYASQVELDAIKNG